MRTVEEILHEWKNRITYFPHVNQVQMVVNTSELKLVMEKVQKKLTDAINTNTEMQAEIRNLRAKVQYWEDKYCLEYHTAKWPDSEVMELRASNEFNKAVARAFGKELVELKEKLLELGGCPNA